MTEQSLEVLNPIYHIKSSNNVLRFTIHSKTKIIQKTTEHAKHKWKFEKSKHLQKINWNSKQHISLQKLCLIFPNP